MLDGAGRRPGARRRPVDGRLRHAAPRAAASRARAVAGRRRRAATAPSRAARRRSARSRREVADAFEARARRRSPSAMRSAPRACSSRTRIRAAGRSSRHQLGRALVAGSANTMRGVQARRPSLYDLDDELARMRCRRWWSIGDEDEHCLQPGIILKRTIPASGLAVLPKTGHTFNLEEPDAFNRAASATSSPRSSRRAGARATRARSPRARPAWTRALRSSAAR